MEFTSCVCECWLSLVVRLFCRCFSLFFSPFCMWAIEQKKKPFADLVYVWIMINNPFSALVVSLLNRRILEHFLFEFLFSLFNLIQTVPIVALHSIDIVYVAQWNGYAEMGTRPWVRCHLRELPCFFLLPSVRKKSPSPPSSIYSANAALCGKCSHLPLLAAQN